MRDLTRGGLASGLIELAATSHHALEINETALPIHQDVSSACEILGFDPLYIANEGCFALFVPEAQTDTDPECVAPASTGPTGLPNRQGYSDRSARYGYPANRDGHQPGSGFIERGAIAEDMFDA